MGNLSGYGIYKLGGSGGGGGTGGIYGGSGTVPTTTTATLTDSLIFSGGTIFIDRTGASDAFTQLRRASSLKISDKLVSGGGARSMRDSGGSDFYSISQGGLLLNRSASIGHFVAPTATLDIVGDGSTSATTSLLVRNSSSETYFQLRDDKYCIITGNDGINNFFTLKNESTWTLLDAGDKGSNVGRVQIKASNNNRFIFEADLGLAVGDAGAITNEASSVLTATSTTRGFLPPRMTGAQVEAISSPATGLQAYATNAGAGDVTAAGWWGYDGANWVQGFSGGGGSSIYAADGTIGSGRVATVTDTLAFRHPLGAVYGNFNFNFTDATYPSFGYASNQIVTVYRANQTYAFGKIGDTTNNFQFNTGANPNFSSVDTVFISGGATHTNTLHVKGGGSTSATSSLLIENSSAETLFSILDDGSSGIGISPTYNLGSGITSLEISDTTSGGVVLRNDADTQTSYWYNHGTGTYFGTNTNNKLNFIQNSIVRMNLDVNGGLSIGQTTTAANTSALLDLASTTKGFLPPRMTTVQMNAIGSPATGLIVYDTTTNQCMLYNGTSWVIMG